MSLSVCVWGGGGVHVTVRVCVGGGGCMSLSVCVRVCVCGGGGGCMSLSVCVRVCVCGGGGGACHCPCRLQVRLHPLLLRYQAVVWREKLYVMTRMGLCLRRKCLRRKQRR